jgi:ABC-type glycerol-3-phosphate transport system substrate-binding protein
VRYLNEDLVKSTAQASSLAPTFEEFRRQAILVTKKDSRGRSLVYGHHIRLDASYVDAFIYANGGELLARDGSKVRFDEAPAVEVFEMWGQMAKDGLAYTTPGFGYQTDFGQAKVASVHDTSASRPFIADAVVERTTSRERFRWGIGMIPQRNPAKPLTATFGGGLVVFKTTPLKQAAMWEWVRFFAEREQTVAWSIASGYMPLRRSAAEHPDLKALWQQSPQAEQSFRLAQYARPEPNITAWQDIRELLTAALSAVVSQSTPAKAALDDAAKRANQLIAEKH